MVENNTNYFSVGALIGASQTILGHPIDTMKTLYQNNSGIKTGNISKNKINLIPRLYAGVTYPLLINLTYNTAIYELHKNFYHHTSNHFTAGFISGGIMSIFKSI